MPDDHQEAADLREIGDLRERARRARYVAHQISDTAAAKGLMAHAEDLECRADALAARYTLPPAAAVVSGEPVIAEAQAALKTENSPGPEAKPGPDAAADKPEPEPA